MLFLAVCCAQCGTFQVQQEKKSGVFQCAICNTKQKFIKIYAHSQKARDSREVVMRMNAARGELLDVLDREADSYTGGHHCEGDNGSSHPPQNDTAPTASGKWSQFLSPVAAAGPNREGDSKDDENGDSDDWTFTDEREFRQAARRRRGGCEAKSSARSARYQPYDRGTPGRSNPTSRAQQPQQRQRLEREIRPASLGQSAAEKQQSSSTSTVPVTASKWAAWGDQHAAGRSPQPVLERAAADNGDDDNNVVVTTDPNVLFG